MKKEFICLNCGKTYISKKENSKWCSKKCQNEYNQILYNCDNCGKEIVISRFKYERLLSGEQKNCFCSRACHNQSQYTSIIKKCKNCGEEFTVYNCVKDSNSYCSMECYNEHRYKYGRINKPITCQNCGKIFFTERKNPKYCSLECSSESQRKRVECSCDYCGIKFEKIESEIGKSKNHYCSNVCRILSQQWNEKDKQILRENYHVIPTKEIIPLLSKEYNNKDIAREARILGLTVDRSWTKKETDLLINLYSNVPMHQVLKALSPRTYVSIIGKAISLNLKSYFYITNRYSSNDDKYLKENYLLLSNDELAKELNRTPLAIQERLYKLNLNRPYDIKSKCYKNLQQYIRSQIASWRNHFREECNYICCVTGVNSNIVVHHCRSFNLLFEETIELLNFNIKDDISDYSENELNCLLIKFLEIQDYYGEYVCINKDVHKLFHDNYGYGDNTIEQWHEFAENYKSGKYQLVSQ